MRLLSSLLLLLPCLVFGQEWEVGGSAGFGYNRQASVTTGSTTGSTGFGPGMTFGAVLGDQINRRLSGEARYTFRSGDLQVASGGTKATAAAQSHVIHYDLLVYGTKKDSKVRPFLAAGGGLKYFRGTGAEPAYQPLSDLVILTHTNQVKPLVSAGGGVKFAISHRAILRFDVRDYLTPVPEKLLATPPNSKINGWMHDIVFLVGISSAF